MALALAVLAVSALPGVAWGALELTVSPPPAVAVTGDNASITATVKNSGAGPAFGATLRVSLPFGLNPGPLPAGCSATGLALTCALGDLPSQATAITTIPIKPPDAGTYTVGASTLWARQSSITADLTIGVLAPTDPDTGSSGLPIDPNALTPAVPETVTLERIARGLPGRNRCVRDRVLDILLRSPGGVDPKTAVVRLGKKVVKRLKGARATAPFTIRVPRSGRFVVRVSVTLTDGRILMASRTYRVCKRR